ncbi:MAG: LCP family protein [Egibacteraceae bacterium]
MSGDARHRARRERRRRWRNRVLLAVLLLLFAASGAVGGAVLALRTAAPAVAARGAAPPAASAGDQDTLLLVRQPGDGEPVSGATLLAAGPDDDQALIVFLPVGTLVELPGFGLDRLGLAGRYGGPGLVQAAVENTLGIAVDHVAAVSEEGLGALLGRFGGLELDIPQRLTTRQSDGTATVRFEAGSQRLDGERLAEYWSFTEPGEDEFASFARQQQVLRRLLEAATDPQVREALVDGAGVLDTTAEPAWIAELVARLSGAEVDEGARFTLLPVEAFGGQGQNGSATFRVREDDTRALVADALAASVPAGAGAEVVRVQVLNGVGAPGVGQEVDARLGGESPGGDDFAGSFRIVRTDNADSFDYRLTRIVIYDERPHSHAAAERVRQVLGVGTIQVSRQPQSVVDLTIVVGADFAAP